MRPATQAGAPRPPKGRPTSRAKRKRAQRDLYLLVARDIFREKGYYGTRVKDITDRAQTSVGNFYGYFESKEAIFEELLTGFYHLFMRRVRALQGVDLPLLADIKRVIKDIVRIFRENEKIGIIFISQMAGINPKFATMKNRYLAAFCAEVAGIIDAFQEQDLIPAQDARVTARAWVGAVLEGIRWWIQAEKPISEAQLVENLSNFVLRGTLEDPSRIP